MNMKARTIIVVSALALIAVLTLGALDPMASFHLVLKWQKPKVYPPPMIQGMDLVTLNTMMESGNLQWYEPRPVQDAWDAVVAHKIHAPVETVWKVATEYENQCKIMPQTFVKCKTQSREGNKVTNVYDVTVSVIMYSYDFEMVDEVVEDPLKGMHIKTIKGGLAGREIDLLLVPVDNGANTLAFMRYFGNMRSLGPTMQLALKVMPMVEPPATVSAANYHLRSVKMEAESRAGYKAPARPKNLEIEHLDLPTLRLLNNGTAGLIREDPKGKLIDVLTYTFVDAPPKRVWEVGTDFEHYDEVFPGSANKLESRDGNTVVIRQDLKFSLLVFDFGYELHSRYTLTPPDSFTYVAIDGLYEGSHGSGRVMSIENGTKTLLVSTAGLNLERDTGLVTRIIKSGAFPVENMLNMLGTQYTLANIKREAEKREGKPPK
jgi:carbon monoxide dehydrogenase subunit G